MNKQHAAIVKVAFQMGYFFSKYYEHFTIEFYFHPKLKN